MDIVNNGNLKRRTYYNCRWVLISVHLILFSVWLCCIQLSHFAANIWRTYKIHHFEVVVIRFDRLLNLIGPRAFLSIKFKWQVYYVQLQNVRHKQAVSLLADLINREIERHSEGKCSGKKRSHSGSSPDFSGRVSRCFNNDVFVGYFRFLCRFYLLENVVFITRIQTSTFAWTFVPFFCKTQWITSSKMLPS